MRRALSAALRWSARAGVAAAPATQWQGARQGAARSHSTATSGPPPRLSFLQPQTQDWRAVTPARASLPERGAVWRLVSGNTRPAATAAPGAACRRYATSATPQNKVLDTVAGVRGALAQNQAVSHFWQSVRATPTAFWQRHALKVYAAGGVIVVIGLWRSMLWVASSTVAVSESLARWGLLALATGLTALGGTFLVWRRTLSPNSVFRHALRLLTASPEVAKVLGSPLRTTDMRAFVLSGGTLRIKNFVPRWRRSRCHLLFPVSGEHDRRGLVSVEAKKVGGEYVFKLLALDVPSKGGVETRIYLAGDDAAYSKHAILAELRDPLIAAMAAQPAHEAEDETDAESSAPLHLEAGSSSASSPAPQAPVPVAAAQSGDGEDPYAWDYLKEWLRRKRAAQQDASAAAR